MDVIVYGLMGEVTCCVCGKLMFNSVVGDCFFDQCNDPCRVCEGVFVVGGLLDCFAAVVKVVVREIFLNHSHDPFSVGVQFGFCEGYNVIVLGSDVVINDFP